MKYLEILKLWFFQKEKIHTQFKRKFPKKGEVWITDFGINIGSEQNGRRPALILKTPIKTERTTIVIPASNTKRYSTQKVGSYHFLLHQIRTVDSKRFIRKVERITKPEIDIILSDLLKFLK